jgi:hypothetical protein
MDEEIVFINQDLPHLKYIRRIYAIVICFIFFNIIGSTTMYLYDQHKQSSNIVPRSNVAESVTRVVIAIVFDDGSNRKTTDAEFLFIIIIAIIITLLYKKITNLNYESFHIKLKIIKKFFFAFLSGFFSWSLYEMFSARYKNNIYLT